MPKRTYDQYINDNNQLLSLNNDTTKPEFTTSQILQIFEDMFQRINLQQYATGGALQQALLNCGYTGKYSQQEKFYAGVNPHLKEEEYRILFNRLKHLQLKKYEKSDYFSKSIFNGISLTLIKFIELNCTNILKMFIDVTFPQKVKITNNLIQQLRNEFEENEQCQFKQIVEIVFDISE